MRELPRKRLLRTAKHLQSKEYPVTAEPETALPAPISSNKGCGKMNLKIKAILTAVLLLVTLTFAAGCSKAENPYQINDAENYNVSVKYDANGGTFTTNTSVIVDSYDLSQMKTDSEGLAQIALLSPDAADRGKNAFSAVNNGYFLAGWYTQRTQTGVDSNGNPQYNYSGRWDFEKDRLTVDPKDRHSSAEPELTLYAAWIPVFQIEYYALDSGELLTTVNYNPAQMDQIQLPKWDKNTGAIEMNDVPKRENYTFNGAYLDPQGKQAVETETISHTGTVDYETATAKDATMKLYVDWKEGEWYRIYTVDAFLDNASLNGCYDIQADLDFSGKIWPTVLMYGSFNGTIQGNGYTFSNISIQQTNNSKLNAGLFGQLSETAQLSDVTFQNVTFTVQSGTRVAGTAYGLLAGTISEKAAFANVQILSSTLQINSGCYFGTDDYTIGLLCGMGSAPVDYSQISCTAVGDDPAKVVITVNGNAVTLEFKT